MRSRSTPQPLLAIWALLATKQPLATGIYGVVIFVSTLLLALVTVDFIGRDNRLGPESACRA